MVSKQALMSSTYTSFSTTTTFALCHYPNILFYILFSNPLMEFLFSADIISCVEFNQDGELLATGDKGGRVVIFQVGDSHL